MVALGIRFSICILLFVSAAENNSLSENFVLHSNKFPEHLETLYLYPVAKVQVQNRFIFTFRMCFSIKGRRLLHRMT